MKYVYGIIPVNGAEYDYDTLAFAAPDGRFELVRDGDVAAVVSESAIAGFADLPRGDLMRYLARHQEAIEEIMDYSTVLPVKFGTLLESDDQVRTLLNLGHDDFQRTAKMIGSAVEFDVAVTWDPADVFAAIANEPEIAAFKEQVAALPPEESLRGRMAIGQLVKTRFDERRTQLRDELVNELTHAVSQWQLNPVMDDSMVANVACLVSDSQLSALEHKVYELDERHGDRLQFRLVGPLPAYSFASVEARLVQPQDLQAACELLQLSDPASTPEQVKHAFYQQARVVHPDVAGDDPAALSQFVRVTEAYRLMSAVAQQMPAFPLGGDSAPRILWRVGGGGG